MSIPTAEEFLKKYNGHDHSKSEGCSCRYRDIVALREFAKLHVKKALIKAGNVLNVDNDGDYVEYPTRDLIINSYPLENIK
jgi:hypothetical protein